MGGGSAMTPTTGVNPNTGMAMTPIPGQNPTPITSASNALAPGIVNMTNPGPSPKQINYNQSPGLPNWGGSNNPFSGYLNPANLGGNGGQGNPGFGNNPFLMKLGGFK